MMPPPAPLLRACSLITLPAWGLAACQASRPTPAAPASPDPAPIARPAPARPSRAQLQSVLEFLSDDLLEGRAPGTRGGQLAAAYVKSLLKLWDIAPGNGDDYLQPFGLQGLQLRALRARLGATPLALHADLMGTYADRVERFALEAPLVFVGFGIRAPQWQWDDYKDVDVRGKIVVARVNDPGSVDPGIFEGARLTYYGRWTYHIEEAERQGAVGILLIHTDASAGYGWSVVESSWGGEALLLEGALPSPLKLRAWIREASLRRALEARGTSLDALYAASQRRDFRPVDLGVPLALDGHQALRQVQGRNVVGLIPGARPERIVLSAHIDHLGVDPAVAGDGVFNGAVDNASAVASMLWVARALKQRQAELRFSVTVLACDAEEHGLLGSAAYLDAHPHGDVIANINFESTPVWEAAGSVMGVGARFSSLEDDLKAVAAEMGLSYSTFSMAEQGFFYRSDQFSFAKRGIPALWISAGEDDASGAARYRSFWRSDYHTPRDAYDPAWPLDAMAQTVEAALRLVARLEAAPAPPAWRPGPSFPMQAAAP